MRELLDPRTPTRLSIQALETLAVIAYKQPVTLPEIIELRGVKSGGVVKTLLEKRLIRITGRKEVVGRPMLYGTTKQFLLHFGLQGPRASCRRSRSSPRCSARRSTSPGSSVRSSRRCPVQVGLSDPDGEQIPLFEEPAAPPGTRWTAALPRGRRAVQRRAGRGANPATTRPTTAPSETSEPVPRLR